MIDWILKVCRVFRQSSETTFRAVYLLDLYFQSQLAPIFSEDLHLLGVVSIFVASKFSETKMISMSQLVKSIGKDHFSAEQIRKKEQEFLKTIDFRLNQPTVFSIASILLRVLELPEKCRSHVEEFAELFLKIFLFGYDVVSEFDSKTLAAASVIIALKLFEYSNEDFSAHDVYRRIISVVGLSTSRILQDLNFLRNFVSCFKESFPFSCLNKAKY